MVLRVWSTVRNAEDASARLSHDSASGPTHGLTSAWMREGNQHHPETVRTRTYAS